MMVKSHLLATAAGAVAFAAAEAADMPPKAEPVRHVKVCTLNVDGFYYIPGTDTCIRISGYVRTDYGWNANSVQVPQTTGTAGAQDRTVSQFQTRQRARLQTDARTPTEFGTLRTVARFYLSNQDQSETSGVTRAFIQWAGLTIGRAQSSSYTYGFSESWQHITQQQNQTPSGEGGVNQISYSLELGNGFTLSLGADERQIKPLANLSNGVTLKVGSEPVNSYAGQQWPDLHVDLKTNQAWGYINTSAMVHNVSAAYYSAETSAGGLAGGLPLVCAAPAQTGTTQCGHPNDKLGWTVASGGEVKLPHLGVTDRIGFFALYAQGKIGGEALASQALFGSGNRLAVGWMTDGVFVNGSQIELTTAWATGLGYEHAWSPVFRTGIFGAYEEIRYNSTARSYFCGLNGSAAITNITLANCNSPNWSFFQGTVNARWAPAPHFELVAEAWYVKVFSAFSGTATLNTAATGARPSGTYTIADQSTWGAAFRAVHYFNSGGG
jgi:Porin subfamily